MFLKLFLAPKNQSAAKTHQMLKKETVLSFVTTCIIKDEQ